MADETPKRPNVERKGLTIHIDGAPFVHVEAPISTRPQDWAPAAREILFADRERRRA